MCHKCSWLEITLLQQLPIEHQAVPPRVDRAVLLPQYQRLSCKSGWWTLWAMTGRDVKVLKDHVSQNCSY